MYQDFWTWLRFCLLTVNPFCTQSQLSIFEISTNTAGLKSRNWRSKSNLVAGSSTAGRFDSCFSFSLAKGNVNSQKRIRNSSSDAIDIKFLHILYVDCKYQKHLYKEIRQKQWIETKLAKTKRSLSEIAADSVVCTWLSDGEGLRSTVFASVFHIFF